MALLPSVASSTAAQSSPSASEPILDASTTPLASSSSTKAMQPASSSSDVYLCRICLEEDAPDKLASPCACSGTQKWAHHDCIQRWISEKGGLRCEVCHTNYQGDFTVPPPAPPRPAQSPMTMFLIQDPRTGQLQVATAGPRGTMILPPNVQFLNAERERMEAQAVNDMYLQNHRNPALSCLFSACIFLLLIVMMHNVGPGEGGTGDGGFDYPSMPQYPPMPPMEPMSSGEEVLAVIIWIFTKILLIGLPIWIVLRVAAKQAEAERAMRSGATLGGTVHAAPAPSSYMRSGVV